MDQNRLGERMKRLRKLRGFKSQEELAKTLREQYGLKCDRPMVGKWEIGYQTPEFPTLRCLADLFRVSLDYLTGQETVPGADALPGLTDQEYKMVELLRQLNPLGRDKALAYLTDLSSLPKYCGDLPDQAEPVAFYAVARGGSSSPQTLLGQAFSLEELPEQDDDTF